MDELAFPIRTCLWVQKNKHLSKQLLGIYLRQEMPTSAAQAPEGDAMSKQDNSSACNWLFGDTADFIYTQQMLLTQRQGFFCYQISELFICK